MNTVETINNTILSDFAHITKLMFELEHCNESDVLHLPMGQERAVVMVCVVICVVLSVAAGDWPESTHSTVSTKSGGDPITHPTTYYIYWLRPKLN